MNGRLEILTRCALYLLVVPIVLITLPYIFDLSRSHFLMINNLVVAIIAVSGLNILLGYTGLISLGHAAFVGVGAYTLVPFIKSMGLKHSIIVDYWPLLIIISGLVTGLLSMLVGLPSLRLKGMYLALATLSFQIVFEWYVSQSKLLNQGEYISLPYVNWIGDALTRKSHYLFWYKASIIGLTVLLFLQVNFLRSKYGRALISVRDNESASHSMGINPARVKIMAFGVSGFVAGISGSLSAYINRGITLPSFNFFVSIEYLTMNLIGGIASVFGSIIGPIAVEGIKQAANYVSMGIADLYKLSSDFTTPAITISFGLAILLFAVFSNNVQGLSGFVKITVFKVLIAFKRISSKRGAL